MRSDRYRNDDYESSYESNNDYYNEPVFHIERSKKKSEGPIVLCILILLGVLAFGSYYYYSHYMQTIKVDVWSLIDEPSCTGVNGEGVPNDITFNEKKLTKFLKNVEATYTTDRAKEIYNILKEMKFKITPSSKISNGTKITVECSFDYDKANKGRYDFNMKNGKNSSPITKKFKIDNLKKEASDADILESFKQRATGAIPGASYEKFYKLTKGSEKRYVIMLSVKKDGKLTYRCLLTEAVTASNALTVGFNEYTSGTTVSDMNVFIKSFQSKGYSVVQI